MSAARIAPAHRILLVEDSRTQALQMIDVLATAGWEALHASSADAALELLNRGPVDLILIDYYLPRTCGDELCRQIRMRIDTRVVPIVLLTGDYAQEVELRGLDSGADDFIPKSVDREILVIRLRALLAKGPSNATPCASPKGESRPARLLAVDDSRTYLAYLAQSLGQEYRLETTHSAHDALARIRRDEFDCVLVDLLMPEMNGIEVCKNIVALRGELGHSVMVLMLTSQDDTQSLASALDAGADDFVGKSSDTVVLKGRIRALLRRRLLEQEHRQRLSAELRAKQLEAERERVQKQAAEARAALIDDLQRTAEALRCSEEELHQFTLAVRGSSDGLWCWSIANDDVWYAPSFKELLGYDDDEFPNRLETWKAHLHPDDLEPVLALLWRHVEHDEPYDVAYRLRTKPGDYRWFRARGKAVRDERGVAMQMAGSLQDVTDLKTAERELKKTAGELARSNEDLERFAYAASHDLRAPLRAIKNLVGWMEEDLAEKLDEENRGRMELVLSRVARLDKLVDDLLQYSRSGRSVGKIALVDANELFAETVELLAPAGIEVVQSAPLPVFVTAGAPLQQVLRNLINNALKHHDRAEGRVEVSARDVGPCYEFTVSDDGPGIAPKFHERVFGLFETLQPRDTVEGSGMGLAIVRRTVERLGGTISLESNGRGATFRFTWSKSMDPTGAAAVEDSEKSLPSGAAT